MNIVNSFFAPLIDWARGGSKKEGRPSAEGEGNPFKQRTGLWSKRSIESSPSRAADNGLLRLKWTERHSFFDPEVQNVLKERHPSLRSFGRASFKGYAIDAWQVVDRFAVTEGRSERALAQFGVFMRLDPVWISKLLSAVIQAQHRLDCCPPDAMLAENGRREQIMRGWAECWIAHYRLHPEEDRVSEPRPELPAPGASAR
jgi:hypothetical protein